MNDVYKNTFVAKTRNYSNTVLTLRLKEDEAVRYWNVFDDAKKRNPYVNASDLMRELLGMSPLEVLTEADIHYFQTGAKITKVNEHLHPDIKEDAS